MVCLSLKISFCDSCTAARFLASLFTACASSSSLYSPVLFILCSHDLNVARYGAKLFLQGLAPMIAISGGVAHQDDLLNTGWQKPEAEMLRQAPM
jgi:3',5'-cyclic AMP phosphodiesterase CpdA